MMKMLRLTVLGSCLVILAVGCASERKQTTVEPVEPEVEPVVEQVEEGEPVVVEVELVEVEVEPVEVQEAEVVAEMEELETRIEAEGEASAATDASGDWLRVKFEVGAKTRARAQRLQFYKTWVEMPRKDDTQTHSRETKDDVLFETTVEKINDDGTAIVRVEIIEAKVTLHIDFPQKDTKRHYVSTAEKTDTNWIEEPAVAGSVYRLRVAPDTTVEEILGLKGLRRSLGMADDGDTAVAVRRLLDEDQIRERHERQFVQFGAGPGREKNRTTQVFPVTETMVKAKAIKKTFTTEPGGEGGIVTVRSTGEAIYSLPRGFEEPPEPSQFGQAMIKDKSDMQDFSVEGTGRFDSATGQVTSEELSLKATLVLLGENVFQTPERETPKGDQGAMYTEITRTRSYTVVE